MLKNFLAWFEQSKTLFKAQPIIVECSKRIIELAFEGETANIRVCVINNNGLHDLSVAFYWDEVWVDFFLCEETCPKKTKNGYICELCHAHDPSTSVTHPTLNALWESHLFQPFLDWVNNTLVTKPYIEILGTVSDCYQAVSLLDFKHDLGEPELASFLERRIINNPLFKG